MKQHVKQWLVIGIVAVLAAAAGVAVNLAARHERTPAPGKDTAAAVAALMQLPLATVDGRTQKLVDWQGKLLVVNFWATWCPPCREEMPEFSRAQDQYGPNGVQFVGIAIDEASNVAEFVKKTPVAYPLLIGPSNAGEIIAKLGNLPQVLPFTLIIGRDGRLVSSHMGRLTERDLAKQLATDR